MINYFCIILLATISSIHTMELEEPSWQPIMDENQDILKEIPIIQQQYEAFINHTVPKINTPCITQIMTQENNEELVDIKKIFGLQGRIQMMPDPQYPVQGPEYNSGLPGNSKMRSGLLEKLGTMVRALDDTSLVKRFEYSPKQIDIHVCDALRCPQIDKISFWLEKSKIRKEHPEWNSDLAHSYALTYAATGQANSPVIHTGGGAVDLRLYNNRTGEYIDMGDFGVPWSCKDELPTFTQTITTAQKKNRLLCLIAAAKADLVNYPYEWWHFSTGDPFYAYWTQPEPQKRVCVYDQIPNNNLTFWDVCNFKTIRALYALMNK